MNIEAISGEWFYDDVTPRGVSFDGFLPQACKIPLGNMQDFELIHTPEKMAAFQSNDWYQKNWSLADTLMTFAPLRSEKSILVKAYRKEMDKILFNPCDSECCQHDALSDRWPTRGSCRGLQVLQEDLSRNGDIMTGNNYLDEGKYYDVKKEIYRLTDRVFAALAKCYKVEATGIFAILDELYKKKVISSEARDNLASASVIAIRLRLSTYLKAGKQGELLSSNSNDKTEGKAPVYHMPTDKELFHFFFVTIPLYDELRQFKTFGIIPSSLASNSFFNDSDITMGHIYCRLLKYDKAIECYERVVREKPNNLSAEIRRIRLALFVTHNTQKSDKIRENLDNLLGKIIKNFSQLDTSVNETTLEFTPLMNCVDMEECRQLIEGLLFAGEIYGSRKYFPVAAEIINLFEIRFTSNKSMPTELKILVLACLNKSNEFFDQEDKVDAVISTMTPFIDEDGVSTRSIVWLNSLGEFLYHQGKLHRAYCCFQRALSMEHLLYGTRPNEKMMTSLHFLGMIARESEMHEERKLYFESLVQLCKSFGGIKSKLLIKDTYLELLLLSCTADESLRYVENGLKVTTGSKDDRELLLNCLLYCGLAVKLHPQQSPERAWEAVLNAQACRKDYMGTHTREKIMLAVGETLCRINKSKEGIELLEKELQKLTLKSQAQEKVLCLKALGKLCLVEGLALEAKKYYSQAINNLLDSNGDVFHDLECRIGILKAVKKEDIVSNKNPALDKALSSALKLPASHKKCSFLQEMGEFFRSIGEINYARVCFVEALRSAKELPVNDKKCAFLKDIGVLCESICEITLARQCYDEALNTFKEKSNISQKQPFVEFEILMRLGSLVEKMCAVDSAQQMYYDRAADITRQHVATGHVNSGSVLMFLALAKAYRFIDKNAEIQLLLKSLEVSEIVYGKDKSQEMVTTTLQELSRTYYMSGDMQNSMKYRERQIEIELELYSSNPCLDRIANTLMKWAFTSFDVPSGNDNIKRVCDFFLSFLNDKAFLLNTTAAKTVVAKCFIFIAVVLYTSSDFEKAKSLNEKASQLFGEVQESVEIEKDPCQETCNLMKTILSSAVMLPSHRTELYIHLFSIGGPYPDSQLSKEELFMQGSGGSEQQNTFVEEQNTLSPPPIVHSQFEGLEDYKSKIEFRPAAEIHASLQVPLLNFRENNLFDGEQNLFSNAVESKDENRPSHAIGFLDLAILQLQIPEARSRRTPKILKLREECWLSEAKLFLNRAFALARSLPASEKKCSFLWKIGERCENISEIPLARLCYDEAMKNCKEELNISMKLPYNEIILEMKLGELTRKTSSIGSVDCEFSMPLQQSLHSERSHYDRAAVILRQHVATGQVDSTTVALFLVLAFKYTFIDPSKKIELLRESLKVSKIVYKADKSHEVVAQIHEKLSDTYYKSGDAQASMKHRELEIKIELELYSSNPFNEHIMITLINWALTSFQIPSGEDSIERVCELFLSSLNYKGFLLNTCAAKTAAAKCFTLLSALFYTSSDFEKAKSLNGKASQLFREIQESAETEGDPCRKTCDFINTILSPEVRLPSHKTELFEYFTKIIDFYLSSLSSKDNDDEELDKTKGTLVEEKIWSNGQKNLKNFVPSSKPGNTASLNTNTGGLLTQTLFEMSFPLNFESIPHELLTPESFGSTTEYFAPKDEENLSALSVIRSQSDALKYHKSKGDFRQAAEIHASLQPQLLNFYKNSFFDGVEKLVSEAIEAKDKNEPSEAIKLLDLALQLQLPEGQCRKTTKILKLRGECFLSMGLFRSAVIDFTKADAVYSTEAKDSREDLCEYSEVLIGLIKSEILCNNVNAARLISERGIKLAMDYELKEIINQQFFYLGAKCLNILSESGENKDENHDKALALCLQAHYSFSKHVKMAENSISLEEKKIDVEMKLLSADILKKRKLLEENEIERNLQDANKFSKKIADIISGNPICEMMSEFVNLSVCVARVLVMEDGIEPSIFWLNKAIVGFFSAALPDFLSFYEEFLPLLQVITAAKSSAPDHSLSPFQQAVNMCKRTLTNQDKSSKYVNHFLTTLIAIYRSLEQTREAMAIAEIGLGITDLMCDENVSDIINNRSTMLQHLAQIHQQNLSNPAFDAVEELNLAEYYYLSDRGREEDMVLCKDLSYANFLCERRRFAKAVAVLEDMRNLGNLLWNKYVYAEYFSCAFYGAGVEKSVTIDGELFTTVGGVLYNLLVRAYVGMGKKKEAVATCEILTDVNWLDVHESKFGKRPSCKPHLIENCHHELLSLLNEQARYQFQKCDFPLSPAILVKLYYILGEYEMALKYYSKDVESSEMVETKISCLRLAANESNRKNESIYFFQQFFKTLHDKEGFLDKPFNSQCEIFQTYPFANQFYLFRSLGATHIKRENIDAAIQCYERCIKLDEDFSFGQDIVATLSELYQTKALTVNLDNEDSRKVYMDLAWELFQKLFQTTAKLTTFVEEAFALLLTRLDRNEEALEHFYRVIERAQVISFVTFANVDKPLVDVYLRREIEALGGSVIIPIKVLAAYGLILTLMKLNQIRKAQKVAFFLERVVKEYPLEIRYKLITHSLAGYAYNIIGNKEKAAEILKSVLKTNSGHPPLIEALESLCM